MTRIPVAKLMSKGALAFRQWRRQTGTSQLQASTLLGYDKLTRLERGYQRPSLPVAIRIQQLTDIPPTLWMEKLDKADKAELALLDQHMEYLIRGPRAGRKRPPVPAGRPRRRKRPKASSAVA
jgi:transcriptional regulator with XRE-family HTH domain